MNMKLSNSMFRASERGELSLHYQPPQINLQAGKIVGVEALLRWKHPPNWARFLPPGLFPPWQKRAV